jgi:hypothetical protein
MTKYVCEHDLTHVHATHDCDGCCARVFLEPVDFPPCAWCGMDEMEEYASFNGGDICVDCAEEN